MERPAHAARPHVLVYHDDPVILQLVRDILVPPYKVTLAASPSDLEAQLTGVHPDLLVLGLPTPKRDKPLRFPDLLRNNEARAIPKIALTTEENWDGAIDATFDAVIGEPFKISALRDAVGRLAPLTIMQPETV